MREVAGFLIFLRGSDLDHQSLDIELRTPHLGRAGEEFSQGPVPDGQRVAACRIDGLPQLSAPVFGARDIATGGGGVVGVGGGDGREVEKWKLEF